MFDLRDRPGVGRWGLAALLAAFHLMAFVDRFTLSVVAGPVKSALRLTESGLGVLQGLAFAIPYAVAILPFGHLTDRTRAPPFIVWGVLVWTAGSALCGLVQSYGQMVGARALMGIGQAAFTPAALGLIGGLFTRTAVARPLSVFTAGSTLGKSVALLAGGGALALLSTGGVLQAAAGHAPWRGVFVLTALPNLMLAAAFWFAAPGFAAPRARIAPPDRTDGPAEAPRAILSTRFFLHAAVAISPIVLIQAAAAWTPLFYSRTFALSTVRSALLLGALVFATAPTGHLIGGQATTLLVRRGVPPALLIGAVLAATVPIAAVVCFAHDLGLSLAAYGVMVLLLGIAAPAGLTGVRLLAPEGGLGAANGVFMSLTTLVGVGLGPTLVGFLSDALYGGPRGLALSLMTLTAIVGVGGTMLAAKLYVRDISGGRISAPI